MTNEQFLGQKQFNLTMWDRNGAVLGEVSIFAKDRNAAQPRISAEIEAVSNYCLVTEWAVDEEGQDGFPREINYRERDYINNLFSTATAERGLTVMRTRGGSIYVDVPLGTSTMGIVELALSLCEPNVDGEGDIGKPEITLHTGFHRLVRDTVLVEGWDEDHVCSPRFLYDKKSDCPAYNEFEGTEGQREIALDDEIQMQICTECGEEIEDKNECGGTSVPFTGVSRPEYTDRNVCPPEEDKEIIEFCDDCKFVNCQCPTAAKLEDELEGGARADWLKNDRDKQIVTIGAKCSPQEINGKWFWVVDEFFEGANYDGMDVSPNSYGTETQDELLTGTEE